MLPIPRRGGSSGECKEKEREEEEEKEKKGKREQNEPPQFFIMWLARLRHCLSLLLVPPPLSAMTRTSLPSTQGLYFLVAVGIPNVAVVRRTRSIHFTLFIAVLFLAS